MTNRHLPVLLLSCIALLPAIARAQERGQTGVAMGFPATVAFIWHVSDTLAVRPEFSFSHSSSESESSFFGETSSSDTWNVSVGTSALWYLQKTDNVRTYFSPRIAFGHSSAESGIDDLDPRTSNTVAASGSFGAQYAPVRRFSVYGEIGYGVSRASTEFRTPIVTSKITGWNWSTRTTVGVILYFGRS